MLKTYQLCLFLVLLCSGTLMGQELQTLSLKEMLLLSQNQSLEAFQIKRQYAQEYWQFRAFKARLLPSLDLELQPFTYNRSMIKRYNPDLNVDVFRPQQNLTTYANLAVNQNVWWTGASIYLSSSFERLVNYGDYRIESYNTTPVRIGIIQPIMGFNDLKWQKKTAELELNRAKKSLLANTQKVNQQAIALFFQWALAKKRVTIAQENKQATARLYEIGKKRYDLGAIEKDDLLNLELDKFTASNDLTRAQQDLKTAISDLRIFLNVDQLPATKPLLPEMVSKLKINYDEAFKLAQQNNPDLLNVQIRQIHADRDLDRAIKENRFDLSVRASFGLNQQARHFRDAYGRFLDQQIVSVNFSMPLLDWGERKGNIQKAKMTRELKDIEIKQDQNEVVKQLKLAVANFNLQEQQVQTALRAQNIAQKSYEITQKRFLSGQVDLLRLTSARTAWQNTAERYIMSLQNYWKYYYQIQELTLHDFIHDIALKEDFDTIISES